MSDQVIPFPASKDEQATSGHYGMVAEFGTNAPPAGPFWVTAQGQLMDAQGNLLNLIVAPKAQ